MGGIAKWRHRNTLRWVHLTAEPLEAKKWPRFITLISQSQGGLAIAVKSYKDRWDVFLNCFFFFFFLPTGIKTTIHNNSVPLSYSFSCLHLAFFSPSIFSVWMFLFPSLFKLLTVQGYNLDLCLEINVMSFCLHSHSAGKCAVLHVIKAKEDFMVDYARPYIGWSYDCNQNLRLKDMEVPDSWICQALLTQIGWLLFHRLGDEAHVHLCKTLNLISSLGTGKILM